MRNQQLEEQLEELLTDPGYKKLIVALAKHVMSLWGFSFSDARSYVLSAIGEPKALTEIHDAFVSAKHGGGNPTYPALFSRRRVIDLMRRDARRTGHISLLEETKGRDGEALNSQHSTSHRDAEEELQRHQFNEMIRRAVEGFGQQSKLRGRQANLLQRRVFDEADYSTLSKELTCNRNALRGRLHAAIRAFYKYIRRCHPEIEVMWISMVGSRRV
jgi:DNA-directed RNA polymerase specialized sigma24 family protein